MVLHQKNGTGFYKPFTYYFLTITLSWISFFAAAYYAPSSPLRKVFMLSGLVVPFAVAVFLVVWSGNRTLQQDLKRRIWTFGPVKPQFWFVLLFLMPAVILAATALSLLFRQPAMQFSFSEGFAVKNGHFFFSLFILFFPPALEELGWRGYGADSLLAGNNILKASVYFACLWGLWHVPLFFIKGYYHFQILHLNKLYALNFFVGLLPASILQNWISYKNGRSIWAIVFFHFVFNLSAEIFQTGQVTKIISTVMLMLISLLVVLKNRKFFLEEHAATPGPNF